MRIVRVPRLRTDIPTINMDGDSWSGGTVDDLMDIPARRINMTDVTRTREHNSNPLDTVIDNSKTAFLFLAFILPNDSPRAVIVNWRAMAGIPNERNDGKGMIGRPIKKVLRVRLLSNWATVLLVQQIGFSYKTSEQRFDCNNRIFWFPHMPNHRFGRINK